MNVRKNVMQPDMEARRDMVKKAYCKGIDISPSCGLILPSKAIRDAAKEIAECGDDPCAICIYESVNPESCDIPYTEEYINEFDVYPCYEGVLRFLSGRMGTAPEETDREDFFEDSDGELKLLTEVRTFVQANLETINALADLTVKVTGNYPMLTEATKYMVSLTDTIRDISDNMSIKFRV